MKVIYRIECGRDPLGQRTSDHFNEIIIRNVDTNLLLKIEKGGFSDTIELNIVGQAYLKDVHGSITCKKFRGIVIVKNDL